MRYIKDNNNLGLKCYVDMNDAPVSELLRQASIKPENNLMDFLILVGKIVQILAYVQEHTLYFIRVRQLTMVHMFQDQFPNQSQKVITMQYTLEECL